MVKIEIQDIRWNQAKEIAVLLKHPLHWDTKFERLTSKEELEAGPCFMEFPVPDIKGGVVKIESRPGKGEIVLDLNTCFSKGQQLFCKVMKWKGASELEGVALRVQLVSEDR